MQLPKYIYYYQRFNSCQLLPFGLPLSFTLFSSVVLKIEIKIGFSLKEVLFMSAFVVSSSLNPLLFPKVAAGN